MTQPFAWTPAESVGYVGSIMLAQRPAVLTPDMYIDALAKRIHRLIVAEGDRASGYLNRVEQYEPHICVAYAPRSAAAVMTTYSEYLLDQTGRPHDPIAAEDLAHSRDAMEYLKSETLEDFLTDLYG